MRYALWFGIAAFMVSGGLFNAIAHNAEGVLGLAFIVGVAAAIYGAHLQNQQEEATDNPAQKVYFISKTTAFHRIKDLLLNYNAGNWSFSQLDPDAGRLTATLAFTEQLAGFGPMPQLPNQPRRITLHVTITTPSSSTISVQLNWSVSSPVNRDQCDAIITHLTKQIDLALTTQQKLVEVN